MSSSFRVFSTVQKDLSPDLFADLMQLDQSSRGKRLVYLAQLGVLLDAAMRKNSGRLSSLVFSCRIPDDCIDLKRHALFVSRAMFAQLIEDIKKGLQ